mmetsp:Transcript_88209/g.175211  ORF Transcript_88209/g.175211 Transcript_88209/m.175211 type:complete len:188 (+) Transcript_88209:127-690(+)
MAAQRIVAPGERLGNIDECLAGSGTYVGGDGIYASVNGKVRHNATDASVEVVQAGNVVAHGVPEVGSTVVAHVVQMSHLRADCAIVAVGETPLTEKFRGMIRKQDVRLFEVDKLRMTDCFRIGDFVRAQILALGDARSYVLTTAVSDNLGVIFARGAAGAPLVPISWQCMKCPQTGAKEPRKVAKPS